MIRHFFTSALANILRTPVTTSANVLTLALGLACFIAAWGVATYWQSGDRYHASADRTFVVGQSLTPRNQPDPFPTRTRSAAPLARYLKADFPDIERTARVYTLEGVPAAAGQNRVQLNAAYVDADFLRIFDFEFLAGDAKSALDRLGSVVLTQDAAARLFGSQPAIGQRVLVSGNTEATVTGVIAPVRQPSFMGPSPDAEVRFDMLGHWLLSAGGASRDASEFWAGTAGWTFVTLKPGISAAQINAQLPALIERRMPADNRAAVVMELELFSPAEIAVREIDGTLLANNDLNLTAVMTLFGLGALTLLVAAINYANLATAQAATRAKEVGMRKTVGASRALIIAQSWLETLLLSLAALALALLILAAVAPALRQIADVNLLYFLTAGAEPLLLMTALVLVVSVLAGVYPALVLSGVRPIQALRTGRSRSGSPFVARILVAIQFATASFLLILLTVTQLQHASMREVAISAQEDPIVALADIRSLGIRYETLEAALAREPSIKSVSVVDREPWSSNASLLQLSRTEDPAATAKTALLKQVGYDYFRSMGLDIVAGRPFDRERETASRSFFDADPDRPIPIVVDAPLAVSLGFSTPAAAVDQTVYLSVAIMRLVGGTAPQPLHIVGVAEADRARVGNISSEGNVYMFAPVSPMGNGLFPVVRIDKRDVSGALAAINRVWTQLSPTTPPGIQFYDELFYKSYRQYNQISQFFILLASTAFAISSIGLLGIAVHVASGRRHEIAVRKTLGSSVAGVVKLLLTEFSIPVLIGNLAAWPLGYFAAQTYLTAFAHRIELTPAPFFLSMAITLAIAWAAVIGVVLKAASTRPAEVLRHA